MQEKRNGFRNEETRRDGARFGRGEAYIMQSMCSPWDLWGLFRQQLYTSAGVRAEALLFALRE